MFAMGSSFEICFSYPPEEFLRSVVWVFLGYFHGIWECCCVSEIRHAISQEYLLECSLFGCLMSCDVDLGYHLMTLENLIH